MYKVRREHMGWTSETTFRILGRSLSITAALRLQGVVDDEFAKLGAKIKGWAVSKLPPAE